MHRIAAVRLAFAFVLTLLLGACATDPLSELAARHPSRLTLPLSGVYDFTAQAPFSGSLTARFYAEPSENGFTARTREGVAWPMIGGLARLLGPVVTPTLFPRGVILEWTSRLPSEEGPGEGWIGVAGLPSLGARTRLYSADEPIELMARDGKRAGLLRIAPVRPGETSETDYLALAESVERALAAEMFERGVAQLKAVSAYGNRLREVARLSHDDGEFVFGAVLAGRAYLRFSLPILWKGPDPELARRFADWNQYERGTLRAWFDRWRLPGLLKVDAFFDPAEVEAAMQEVIDRDPEGLVIDVRSSPGVTLASLLVLCALVEEPVDAGIFFSAERRAPILSGDTSGVSTVNVRDASSIAELESVLEREGAARVRIEPATARYKGPAYVLTSRRTSTSAEPLVWMLQHLTRAPAVGQTTAGRPLVSIPVSVGQGWTLWVAAYDYLPPTGLADRFNGKGVRPLYSARDAVGQARELLKGSAEQPTP